MNGSLPETHWLPERVLGNATVSVRNSTRAHTFPAEILHALYAFPHALARRLFSGFSALFCQPTFFTQSILFRFSLALLLGVFLSLSTIYSYADHVYDSHSSTAEIYNDVVRPVVKSVLQGFNGTRVYNQFSFEKKYC